MSLYCREHPTSSQSIEKILCMKMTKHIVYVLSNFHGTTANGWFANTKLHCLCIVAAIGLEHYNQKIKHLCSNAFRKTITDRIYRNNFQFVDSVVNISGLKNAHFVVFNDKFVILLLILLCLLFLASVHGGH